VSIVEESMTPEVARACIFSFFWQLSKRQDRRVVMNPAEAAALKAQQKADDRNRELSLIDRVTRQAGRFFGDRKREEYLQSAGKDALGELEAGRDTRGVVNHATGLPEGANDLGSGREVMRGEDLAMAAALPCWGLATIVSQTNETPDGEWIAIGYKALKVHCQPCKALGRLPGEVCPECKGQGQRRASLFIPWKRAKVHCELCSGHGRLPGPSCGECNGQGTKQNWSEEEYETVRFNARLIAREVHRMAEAGLMIPDPGLGQDAETDDILWQDGQGDALLFRITRKGYAAMQDYMNAHPELQKVVPILEFAGADVRSQAPQWAQAEYEQQRR
jgi:hypothetical protein